MLQSGVRTYHPAYSFQGGLHGQDPASAMIADHSGNLYGTTVGGGISGFGTVYEVTLSTSGSVLTETALYSFQGSADGGYPEGGLVFDQSGNLYGTTSGGGGSGTVFELAPPSAPGGAWSETVLHLFVNLAGGLHPNASLTFGKAGSLYSTAPIGGTNNAGVAFRVAP